ncbi:hypothetical protein SAMN04489867_2388 [Pedococcus dokdonensis]|uniref:Thioesterase-like superfamily protein n=1 Tax=Pedococcus dokdonensis TaxID=443156 RepID=A0A1H0SJF2_9MICO|nr:hypothetical protein [Pedococcus dokdonensis]SDP41873.1 hypothetical protein SAMN04489867_2388 [Pedococcus dokdonensis]
MGFLVPSRFCGPPESGNGGWVSGHVAALLQPGGDESVTVRLRTPPPLDRELQVSVAEVGGHRTAEVADGPHPVAQATTGTALQPTGIPASVSFAAAVAAGEGYEGLDGHPFPTCFSCGTAREPGDGLGLRPGRVAGGDGEYAAAWVPDGDVDVETVWAALDCPGGWASGIAGRPMVLGTMTATVTDLPVAGEEHVVMAWPRGGEGRKYFSATALYAADGRLLGQAQATWIAIDPTAVRPAGGSA